MKHKRTRGWRPVLETLDDRTLPSATATAALVNGVLTIRGTDGPDRVTINVVEGRNILRTMGVRRAIDVAGVGRIALNAVGSLVIDTGAGDDQIRVNVTKRSLRVEIYAGAGNDTIRGSTGNDRIFGGTGNDVIQGRGGRDIIDPGPGSNRVNGRKTFIADPVVANPSLPSAPTTPAPSATTSKPTYIVIPNTPASSLNVADWVSRLTTLVNAERAARGLGTLTYNAKLAQIADIQTEQMVQFGLMQHELPGARYPDMRSRADAVGYRLEWLGENLAYNYPDVEGVIQAWLNSQSHRENLFFAAYTEMGISVRLDANGRPYIALEMGKPSA